MFSVFVFCERIVTSFGKPLLSLFLLEFTFWNSLNDVHLV